MVNYCKKRLNELKEAIKEEFEDFIDGFSIMRILWIICVGIVFVFFGDNEKISIVSILLLIFALWT